MTSQESHLSSLVSLIANATQTVEALFHNSSKPFVPSLDDTSPHPFDTEMSSPELRRAVQIIEGTCAQLCATVSRPNHTAVNILPSIDQKIMQIYEPASLRVVIRFKIPDILQDKPAGMHVSEISQKSGIEVGKLSRILRILATTHCFREVAPDVFANNRISMQFLSTNPLSSIALHFTDEVNKATSMLSETLVDPIWGPSYAPDLTPFNKWSKSPLPFFSYLQTEEPEAIEHGSRFAIGMLGWNTVVEAGTTMQYFPWGSLGDGASVCDVGGGVGHVSLQLAKEYPNLRFILQDKPERVEQARNEVWPAEYPQALEKNQIEFKAFDFFTDPPVEGCDVYYLRYIIHNWPDKESIKILRNVRASMKPSSRVLIHEYLLPYASRVPDDESQLTQAQPLLPNYGVGQIRPYNVDIDMMVMFNSRERRLDEFIGLGHEAGLEFEKYWDMGEVGILEFRLLNSQGK